MKAYEFIEKNIGNKVYVTGDGYFVCSTGNASMETIRKYIEEQG